MELREFTDHDWDYWAGAECSRGRLPMIGEAVVVGWEDFEWQRTPANAWCDDYDEVNPDAITLIVDAGGIGIYGVQDCWVHKGCSYEHAVAAAKAIVQRTGEITVDDLIAVGFD